jgi:hypothetical protein
MLRPDLQEIKGLLRGYYEVRDLLAMEGIEHRDPTSSGYLFQDHAKNRLPDRRHFGIRVEGRDAYDDIDGFPLRNDSRNLPLNGAGRNENS